MSRRNRKILLGCFLVLLAVLYFATGLGGWLTLEQLQSRRAELFLVFSRSPSLFILIFFLLYTAIATLSLPGAVILNLAAGFFFGTVMGTALVMAASVMGACVSFTLARTWFLTEFRHRLGIKARRWDAFFRRDGFFLLFALRLIPVFPFLVVNLLFGLTPMRLRTFTLLSILGLLPGTLLYVHAGQSLTQITDIRDVLSWQLGLMFAGLGLLPFVLRKMVEWVQHRTEAHVEGK